MTRSHHYARNGKQYGPVSVAELQNLLSNNRLAPTDLVWTEGMPDWKPAAQIPGLLPPTSPAAAARVPQVPPAPPRVPAPPEQSPAPSATAPEPSPAAIDSPSTPTQTIANRIQPFLTGVRETATATGQHLGRLFASGIAQGKIVLARRDSLRIRAALGQKMYTAGLGDAKSRRLVDELAERIRNLKAAGSSARPLESELSAAHAALAESALECDQAPQGLTAEFEAARTARNGLQAAQTGAADARTNLRSMHAQQALRIGTGYVCAVLVLTGILWASRGTGTADRAAPDPVPQGSGEEGGGNLTIPVDAPAGFVPLPVNVSQKSMCLNCNGTGQANCLQCFGTGKRNCFNCNSTGRTPNNLQCFQCNGTGRQNCSFCQYGKVQCPQCFGSGQK